MGFALRQMNRILVRFEHWKMYSTGFDLSLLVVVAVLDVFSVKLTASEELLQG